MLGVPLALGLARSAAPAADLPPVPPAAPGAATFLIVPAVLLVFLSRSAAVPAASRLVKGQPVPEGFVGRRALWAGLYLMGSVLCLTATLRGAGPATIVPATGAAATMAILGGAQTLLALAGRGRSVAAELLGMAGLAAAAPLVVAVSGRRLDGRGIGVGLVALLYFASSLAYVRAWRAPGRGSRSAWRSCIVAHAVLAAIAAVLWAIRWVPPGVLLAFVPVVARTVHGLRVPPPSVRALGGREVVVAALFTLVAVAGILRSAG